MEKTPILRQAGGRESLPSVGGAVFRLRQCGLCRFVVWLPYSVGLNGLVGEPFQPIGFPSIVGKVRSKSGSR